MPGAGVVRGATFTGGCVWLIEQSTKGVENLQRAVLICYVTFERMFFG
jgi:hypothetical protein